MINRNSKFMNHESAESGFTMVEILVVLSIFGMIMLMGLFFDFSLYRGTSFHTDVDIFASVLQRARARAVNNINQINHGVYIGSDSYILFQGAYNPADPLNQDIGRNPNLTFSGVPGSGIIFSQISGNSNFEGDIVVSGFGKTATVQLNYEGLISR